MDHDFDPGAEELRGQLRQLIEENLPEGFLGAFSKDPEDLQVTQRFCKTLAAAGLLAITWPEEFGGRGGSVWEQTVVREEMWAHHEPRGPQYMGLNWVGPAIMRFGTPEQQRLHLPRISDGDVIWCQGFSEPEAGSDLAGLRTRAVPDGEGWRITGQKVWTSYALIADWCMLAARTSKEDRRQQGITLFMLPMDRAGITARPIESLLGPHHLNEVFFDDVYVGPDEVLGAVGDGWSVMRDALAYERVGIARYARCERLLSEFRHSKGEEWADMGEEIKGNWIEALMNARTARLLAYRAIFQQQQNQISDATASRARIAVTQSDQQTADVLGEALGARLFDDGTVDDAPLHGAIEDHWRYSQAATVASGTLEVQLMLVARELLGTPSK